MTDSLEPDAMKVARPVLRGEGNGDVLPPTRLHTLPPAMILLLRPFAPLFSRRVWNHVQVLLTGAILAPVQRTVTAALRVMGLGDVFTSNGTIASLTGITGRPSPSAVCCLACS